MSDHPVISFCIVSWNVRGLLTSCLNSIERYVTEPHEIIVVDNASRDGTVEAVRQFFSQVKLIANEENLGFATANNQAFREARGEFLVLLNPDTELIDDPFPPLLDYLRQHLDCAAVGPEMLNPDRSHQQSVRNFPRASDQLIVLLKLRHLLQGTPIMRRYLADPGVNQRQAVDVDQIMGGAMIVPRRILTEIGDFDERYWIWFEEVDWCRRAHLQGYSIVYHPGARVVHFGGQSFGQVLSFRKQQWFVRSLRRYAQKFWTWPQRLAVTVLTPISLGLSFLQTLIIRY